MVFALREAAVADGLSLMKLGFFAMRFI